MEQCTHERPTHKVHYLYIVKGKKENIALEVDDRDVIENADGDIDCPLDVVLRKNDFTFDHLNIWQATEIHFIRSNGNETETLHKISLDMNL